MLKIRFSKVGRKHEPVYRLVLTESQNAAKSGKAIEILGSYDSRRAEKAEVKAERVLYWVSKGAKLSDTAHNLLLRKGVIKGERRSVLSKKVIEEAKNKKLEAQKAKEEAEKIPEPIVEETPTQEVVTEETQGDKIEEAIEEKVEEVAQ